MALVDVEGFSASNNMEDFAQGGLLWNVDGRTQINAGGAFGDNYAELNVSTYASFARVLPSAYRTLFCGFRFATSALGIDSTHQIALLNAASGEQLAVTVDLRTGTVQAVRGGALLATSDPGAFPNTGAWAYLEIGATIEPAAGSVSVRVNGRAVLLASGVNTANSAADLTVAQVEWRNAGQGGGAALRVQHFYCCDDTGPPPNNGFLGDVRVQRLPPNGPGDRADFTPHGAGANWQAAGAVPPQPGALFNEGAAAGQADLFALAPMTGYDKVYGVATKILASRAAPGQRSLQSLLRSGATAVDGAPVPLGLTPTYLRDVFPVDPATGAAWTPDAISALQLGYGIVA